jgi:Rrf2 family protein
MNKMSKKTEYALMALKLFQEVDAKAHSASNDQASGISPAVSAQDIAARTHAPYEVIAKVLQILSSRGILKAEYGVMGGYQLSKNLSEVSVHDLMDILESSTELTKCLGKDHECDLQSKCTILNPVTNLNLKVQNFYKSISLSEVLRV